MILALIQKEELSPIGELIFLSIIYLLCLLIVVLIAKKIFNFFEMAYVEYINKSLFVNHIYFNKQKLSKDQRSVLKRQFKFYQKLSLTHQSYFEHRVFMVIKNMEFIGKDLEVTQEMKVMISATLVKLTFGLRDYRIKSVERIIFYPDEFYSQTNKAYHKGEFNLGYKALVFSWKDVLHGYDIEDDNLNLAVHEFTHAIHFYFMRVRHRSASAAIFLNAYVELTTMLDKNPKLKSKLIKSQFLREYAFTNQFEFLSVVIETFIESPDQFKAQFPQIYMKVKTMLNFNFAGY